MADCRFEENGILFYGGEEINSISAVSIGYGISFTAESFIVGASSKGFSANAVALALCSGLSYGGKNVILIPECIESELGYITKKLNRSCGIFVDSEPCAIRFYTSDGIETNDDAEKKIETSINFHSNDANNIIKSYGKITISQTIGLLYEAKIENISLNISSLNTDITSHNKRILEICKKFIPDSKGDDNQQEIIFSISENGKKASAYTDSIGFISHEQLAALCCIGSLKKGRDIALPYSFPKGIDDIARQYGCKVTRYSEPSPEYETDFLSDGIILVMRVLEFLSQEKISPEKLAKILPDFHTSVRILSIDNAKTALQKLSNNEISDENGVWISQNKGKIFAKASKTGKSIILRAESFSVEASSELCDFIENTINEF